MIKLLSCFSGIGAFEKALKNLGIEYELVGFSEIDKYAVRSYCAIHDVPESMNLGDITKIDETTLPKYIDLITYGFPCQDISIAGKKKGLVNDDGTQTRSGLFFDALRIIEATKPKIAIAENVKNLVGKKSNAQFQVVLASLESAGYNNYWSVLNSKDFGVPQNRERVFIVSIRKDIDRGLFQFPVPIALNKRLKDVLETVVDEKYFIPGEKVSKFTKNNDDHSATVGLKQMGQMYPSSGNPQAGRIYDANGICPTIDTCSGGNRMPKIAVCIGGIGEKKSNGGQQYYQQNRVYQGDIALAHPASIPGGSYRYAVGDPDNPQYRKLTPKECFRLFGFEDHDFERAKQALNKYFYKGKDKSDSQLYKQAGNSIVVDVLEAIFSMMFAEEGHLSV